jgi:hypothetical protein
MPANPSKRSSAVHRLATFLLPWLVILALGCGKKGDPLPPQSYAPATTRDLALRQQGSVLIAEMTYPQTTSAGSVLPGLEALEVWDAPLPPGADPATFDEAIFQRTAQQLTKVQGPELASGITGDRLQTRIALEQSRTDDTTHLIAIRTISSSGDVSQFSNRVALRLAAAPVPPVDLRLEPRATGVRVAWQPPAASGDDQAQILGYNVYRKPAINRTYGQPLGRVPADVHEFLDQTAAYGERFFYTVRTIAGDAPLVESEAAAESEIDFQDTFAPAPPVGLTALAEGARVRLLIDPSPSEDVAGYVVFRRDPGSEAFRRLNDAPIDQLEYLDSGLASGLTYEYRVCAVDTSGNQGDAGTPVEVTVR